ncbi:hypothetical protein BDN72DRAFT_742526, partial [Pluteus cervinus]
LVEHTEAMAARALPPDHSELRDQANEILKAKNGGELSDKEVIGKEWTYRFMTRHSDHLKSGWSHGLDVS